MSTPREVRKSLAAVANAVVNGTIEVKQANCVIYAASTILSSLRIDEQETRIDELERALKELEAR